MVPSPAKKKSDDLFEKSTMTFGEHLEELRGALAKSFLWLAIGMGISLLFANNIIDFIEIPLRASLKKYYFEQSEKEWVRQNGTDMPESVRQFMRDTDFTPSVEYIIPSQLQKILDESNKPIVVGVIPAEAADKLKDQNKGPSLISDKPAEKVAGPTTVNPETKDKPQADKKALVENAKAKADKPKDHPVWLPSDLQASELRPFYAFRKIYTNTEALSVTEPFMIYLKVGLVAGIILASPLIFWHIWSFISAGMYPHERRYVYFFLPAGLFLFLGGAALAFFGVFQPVLEFLLTFNSAMGIDATPRMNEYMSFAIILPLGFGVAFQLPLVMLILERLGICSVQLYLSQWRWALIIIAFISMILTPGDVSVMIAMMLPLIGLYYIGIAMCHFIPKGSALGDGGYDAQ